MSEHPRPPDSPENPDAGQGMVLLDIGGDVGALIVVMPAELVGHEVEVLADGEHPTGPQAEHRPGAAARDGMRGLPPSGDGGKPLNDGACAGQAGQSRVVTSPPRTVVSSTTSIEPFGTSR